MLKDQMSQKVKNALLSSVVDYATPASEVKVQRPESDISATKSKRLQNNRERMESILGTACNSNQKKQGDQKGTLLYSYSEANFGSVASLKSRTSHAHQRSFYNEESVEQETDQYQQMLIMENEASIRRKINTKNTRNTTQLQSDAFSFNQ